RRAFKQALFAVRDQEAALDIVQDAMMRLAEKYGGETGGGVAPPLPRPLQKHHPDFFFRHKGRAPLGALFFPPDAARECGEPRPARNFGNGRRSYPATRA